MSAYTPIQSMYLQTPTSSITFSNIPSTYQDLVLVMQLQASSTSSPHIILNNDTSSTYSSSALSGNGSAISPVGLNNQTILKASNSASVSSTDFSYISTIHFINYKSTSFTKQNIIRSSSSASGTDLMAGLWRNSSDPIRSITITTNSASTWSLGSTFDLYGVLI
jgi:hypothetical protein